MAGEWFDRAVRHLSADVEAGRVAFGLTVVEVGWPATRKALSRAGASFIRISNPAGGAALVVGTCEPDPDRVPVAGNRLSLSDATARLAAAFDALAGHQFDEGNGERNRPVTASRSWGPATSELTFTLSGTLQDRDPQRIRSRLDDMGIPSRPSVEPGGWLLQFRATPGEVSQIAF